VRLSAEIFFWAFDAIIAPGPDESQTKAPNEIASLHAQQIFTQDFPALSFPQRFACTPDVFWEKVPLPLPLSQRHFYFFHDFLFAIVI